MEASISRRLEFDAGHRIPDHDGQCRNLHGHRYVLELTLTGEIVEQVGAGDHGMVMDFGLIKKLANEHLVEKWDHAFLVCKSDQKVCEFLLGMAEHKTVVLDKVPTVENLAAIAFDILQPVFKDTFNHKMCLSALRLYETPNCWADVRAKPA